MFGLAVGVFGCCASGPEPGGDGSELPVVLPWERPTPREVRVERLGKRPWIAAIVSPDDRMLVATPDTVRLQTADVVVWETTVAHPPRHLAFSADAKQVGALGRSETGEWLLVLDAVTGDLVHEINAPFMPSPSIERGSQPSAEPTGLVGADGGGFWILNAYGTHRAGVGAKFESADPVGQSARRSQDLAVLWTPKDKGLAGPDGAVGLGYYPQIFAVRGDRIVARDATNGRPGRVVLHDKSGQELRDWKVDHVSNLALLPDDDVLLEQDGPTRFGVLSAEKAPRWLSGSAGFAHVGLSPDGKRAVGSGHGSFQVLDLDSGEVLCDDLMVGNALAVGFDDADTLWALAPADGAAVQSLPALAVRRVRLDGGGPGCSAEPAVSSRVAKTTNLLPVWLPAARAFFLLGLLPDGGYGPVLIPVDDPAAHVRVGGGDRTPGFAASVRGDRMALWTSESTEVYAVHPRLELIASLPGALGVALCDDVIAHGSLRGWRIFHGNDMVREFGGPQPSAVHCFAQTLWVATYQPVSFRTSIETGRWEAFSMPARTVIPLDDSVLSGAGPTGWTRSFVDSPLPTR